MIANSCDLFTKSYIYTTVEWKFRTALGNRWEFITLPRAVPEYPSFDRDSVVMTDDSDVEQRLADLGYLE